MNLKNIFVLICTIIFVSSATAEISVKIIHLGGNVKIRYGLEENWKSASVGILLKEIDTILTGENSEVVLKYENGNTFQLGSNSMIFSETRAFPFSISPTHFFREETRKPARSIADRIRIGTARPAC